jgi:hypothetical protein
LKNAPFFYLPRLTGLTVLASPVCHRKVCPKLRESACRKLHLCVLSGAREETAMNGIDFSKLIPVGAMVGEDEEETSQLRALYETARRYIESFRWAGQIEAAHFGLGVADIVGVFLFEFIPVNKSVDSLLWVVVGDIPSAYLVVDESKNPAQALDSYIFEMNEWVDAAQAGKSTNELIPVNVKPTIENAKKLRGRLEFLKKEILEYYKDDLQ